MAIFMSFGVGGARGLGLEQHATGRDVLGGRRFDLDLLPGSEQPVADAGEVDDFEERTEDGEVPVSQRLGLGLGVACSDDGRAHRIEDPQPPE